MRPALILSALLPALALMAPAGPARAHPHEFVDATVGFVFDSEVRLTGFEVTWRYDDFTTMLILTDLGLNPAETDLTAEAAPELQGFDTDWVPGYDGDLWPMADGAPLAMAPPVPGPVTLEGGRIVSRHARALLAPVDPRAAEVVVQVYDPEFYIAYTVAQASADLAGTGCRARVFAADFDAAYGRLAAALEELTQAGGDLETGFPRVGRDFADEIRIDCAQPPDGD